MGEKGMQLETITVTLSPRFRRYQAVHPELPSVIGALAYPGSLMQVVWNQSDAGVPCFQPDRRERERLENAFRGSRHVNATIDLQSSSGSIIVVRVSFFPKNTRQPLLRLSSSFSGHRQSPGVTGWLNFSDCS
jgi:hypothetical protein